MLLIFNIPRCCEQIYNHKLELLLTFTSLNKDCWTYPSTEKFPSWFLLTSSSTFLAPLLAGSVSSSSSPSCSQIHLMGFIWFPRPHLPPRPCSFHLRCLFDWWIELTNQVWPGTDRPSHWLGTYNITRQTGRRPSILASPATSASDVTAHFRVWGLACWVATKGARWCDLEAQVPPEVHTLIDGNLDKEKSQAGKCSLFPAFHKPL